MNNKEIVFEKLTVDEEEVERLTVDEESKVRGGGGIIPLPERPCIKATLLDG
jgi:hypothetical protein